MTSTTIEQATLGQYFATRRKGLEDVHPAKRRKVDMGGVEGEVAVRRNGRSKKQAASFQSKISTRASKATKGNGKAILKEQSIQTPAKAVSVSTSLFDDHTFAEALIGKLTDAQRKRKMAASSTQRDDAITSAPKDKGSEEVLQGQPNECENESRPKIRRRIAKSSKTTQRSINSDKSNDLDAEEEIDSLQLKEKSSSNGKSLGLDDALEKETTASPSKTPPVVRRVGDGIKADPWIAEQAKMVLSRGRAAVNLSQKRRGKEDVKQQAGATEKSSSVENSEVTMNKVQEDLAKARKLIRSMRSLEKSVPQSSLSSTEDNGSRLHQMATVKKNEKEKSQSLKDVPAYQRFHALAQPTPSEASSTTLPLPFKYKVLAEMFRSTDTILNLLGQRKEKCTFTKLRDAVQQMSRKRFEKKHLAQMKTVYPKGLEFHQDKCPGRSSSFELIIEFGKTEEAPSKLTLTAAELLARRDTFRKNLLETTKRHHQDFLSNLNPSLSVDDDKIMRWHPKFHLDEVPDVEEGKLPQPPVVKTYSSANDVLEKARDTIAPRVAKALKAVALKEQGEELTSTNKGNNFPEKEEMTKSTENMQNKNSLKNKAALKGISEDLLKKIRQKEAKKREESMMRDPLVDKKLAMKERLPELCRILKVYFSAERKAAIPLEDATVKLSDSYKTSLSSAQVEEHIRFMSQLVPEWVSILTVRKCAYIKINKTADVNNVINKLLTKEIQ